MSWYRSWRQPSLRVLPDVTTLHGSELSDEQTRTAIEKTRVEILDGRSWRTKLFLSLIIPVGGAFAFLSTWINDHNADRVHRNDQVYSDAAQQLSSGDASVRLNAVLVLSSFITERSWFERIWEGKQTDEDCGRFESIRGRQSVALLIGHLRSEQDASVLDEIANVAEKHPCLTLNPVLSMNRSAGVQFARSAGNFAGLYLLRQKHRAALQNAPDDLAFSVLEDLNAITRRTGSPFEAKDIRNETFVSRPFLESNKCAFREIYQEQFSLAVSSGFSAPLMTAPPKSSDVQNSMNQLIDAAALLEKTSYVLAKMASTPTGSSKSEGLDLLEMRNKREPLYGIAIVVGEITPETVKSELEQMGVYVQRLGVAAINCPIPPTANTR